MPDYTGDTTGLGTVRLLEAIRAAGVPCRFYQASSSEMYGAAEARILLGRCGRRRDGEVASRRLAQQARGEESEDHGCGRSPDPCGSVAATAEPGGLQPPTYAAGEGLEVTGGDLQRQRAGRGLHRAELLEVAGAGRTAPQVRVHLRAVGLAELRIHVRGQPLRHVRAHDPQPPSARRVARPR